MTYAQADDIWGTRKRKLANNTLLVRNSDGSYGIQLHSTQVVILFPDGCFELRSGGWETVTTKQRINAFAPLGPCVSQVARKWYVATPQGRVPFVDGMQFDPSGKRIVRVTPSPEMRAMLEGLVRAN